MNDVVLVESPPLSDEELNRLFAASWPRHVDCTFVPVLARSLVYVGAYRDSVLVGFVYVAWDGGVHTFLLEPTVHPDHRHQGIGTALVHAAARAAARSGAEWLHMDYEPSLEPFYRAAGFRSTLAGLIDLTTMPGRPAST